MNEVEIPLKITGIGAIKAELRDLKGQIADATDPAVMTALAQRAGELKDRLKDANEQIAVFTTGSKFEAVSTSFGQIGSDLASLDFEGASEKASVFAKNLGSLNPADLAKGFKGFTSVITTVGGAFVKLGVTILANPIFLLVAVITVIVVAIGVFLKKIGVLDAVFKAIMGPINAVIQGFKDLTDWMGLTDNAAEENAEAVKESSEKNIESIKQQSKAQQDLFNLTKDLSDEEIAALEEKYGIQVDTSQSIFDLKQEEIDGLQAENQRQIDSLNLKKELTEEDKKRLAELNKTKFDLGQQEIANEANRINTIKNLNMSLDKQIEMLQAKQIKGESERASAMLDIQLKEALSKADQQMKEARQLGDTAAIAKAQQLRALIITDFERQRLEITNKGNAAVAKSNTSAAVKSVQETKSNEAKKLDDMRKAGANAIAVLEKNSASEEDIQAEKLKQLDAELAYVQTHRKKLYKLAVDQDAAILRLENDIKKIKDKTLAQQEKEDNANAIAKLERAVLNAEAEGNAVLLAEKALLEEQSRQKMLSLEIGSEEALLLADETAKKLKDIDKQIVISDAEKNLKILQGIQLVAETKLSKETFDLERFKGTADQQIAQQEAFLTTTLATLNTQRIAELAALNLSEEEKAAIEEKFRQAKITAEEATAAKLVEIDQAARDKLNENINAGFQLATTAASSIASLQEINTKKKLKGVQQGSKEEEKILKQQFEQQKRMNIAMAVINGAQAIASILAQYPKFDGGFAMAAALAGSVIATATSLATIASTSFEGGGTAPEAPDTNSLTGNSTEGMATPSASLFGSNNNLNNVGGQQDGQQGQSITVNAIVSETQVTDVQNRINRIQRNAEL
jgi:hypothetical protein